MNATPRYPSRTSDPLVPASCYHRLCATWNECDDPRHFLWRAGFCGTDGGGRIGGRANGRGCGRLRKGRLQTAKGGKLPLQRLSASSAATDPKDALSIYRAVSWLMPKAAGFAVRSEVANAPDIGGCIEAKKPQSGPSGAIARGNFARDYNPQRELNLLRSNFLQGLPAHDILL